MRTEVSETVQRRDAASPRAVRLGPRRASRVATSGLGETVRQLNERGLLLLAKAAQVLDTIEAQASWLEILPLWAGSSESIVGRAASCPMVLLDFNFQRLSWWSRVIEGQPCQESRQPKISAFHTDEALALARDLLLEAWSAGRSSSAVSSLAFGMAPAVSTLVARLSPRDLNRIAVQEIQELRLRWENRPMFWKELFYAATQANDELLGEVHLHCLQLLGGELVSMREKPLVGAHASHRTVNLSLE
jgi:hypothetical protein